MMGGGMPPMTRDMSSDSSSTILDELNSSSNGTSDNQYNSYAMQQLLKAMKAYEDTMISTY